MARPELLRLVPGASAAAVALLDPARGPLERANRSEIFGPERFSQHGRSLGATHAARFAPSGSTAFFPRLRDNIRILREAHRYIGEQASAGHDMSTAAEWLLDNFHLVEAQLREIHQGLPRRYFRDLPILRDEPLVGLPRIYGVAWAFVAHTDGAFDEELLVHFLKAYEQTRELTLGELWALPTTLRVVLVENLRRLAERTAANKAAREIANLCSDRLDTTTPEQLDAVLALLNRRGVGEPFLAQMAQRLQAGPSATGPDFAQWLLRVAPNLAEIQTRLPAAQAANNLSVGNAITSLRSIGDADWPDIVAETSALTRTMMASAAFAAERNDTRDTTLHAIEALARKSGRSERTVAEALLARMHQPGGRAEEAPGIDDIDPTTVAGHWLRGTGRTAFLAELGLDDRAAARWRAVRRRAALPAYLGTLLVATTGLVAWILVQHSLALAPSPVAPWLTVLAATLLFIPASEGVVAVVNRLISESTPPSHLPRLAFASGIPPEHRVLVVVPAIVASAEAAALLAHQLHLHYLANPERQAQFALLTDWVDADTAKRADDTTVLDGIVDEIEQLNRRHPTAAGHWPRFLVLHRGRCFSESEQRWMGWERKRGKIEQLVGVLAGDVAPAFIDLGRNSTLAPGIRYLLTLDSDTRLPPGRLRDLVGVAAHPHNRPRLSADGRRVERGYGILQPHVATPLPAPQDMTLYHWLFSGQPGIDPYSAAISEVYQDVFGEGTFTGKGLMHVDAVHAVLGGRLPENRILSHDLLEGSLARCAAVTDVNVMEDAPFHPDVAASRVHRWTRGDWQLLPVLLHAGRFDIRAVNRWKMVDNLRRSLVAPASIALLGFALATSIVSPAPALLLVVLAFSAGPLMGALAGFAPSRDDIAKAHFFAQAAAGLGQALMSGAWQLAQLMQSALMAADAIVLALYRMLVSRRHLLEWMTAAAAEASVTTSLPALVRKHWAAPLASLVFWITMQLAGARQMPLATALCVLWALSPVWTWWASRRHAGGDDETLPAAEREYLSDLARDTWRLFERVVVAGDHALPPDNLQTLPHDMVAHRTSPTNIGLYLLAAACARAFGWIGTNDLMRRIEATLATVEGLQRHRGHLLNWYDTETAQPLLPMYVSTVDSGNLCLELLAVAEACMALAPAPHDMTAMRRALLASTSRIAALRAEAGLPLAGPVAEMVALPDPFAALASSPAVVADLLDAAAALAGATPPREPGAPASPAVRLAWLLEDHVALLRSAALETQGVATSAHSASDEARRRLRKIAATCRRLAREADFHFLYHPKRRLFHIGYRVAEQQFDASFYDLLASEARATSLWAIAKGDVPAAHWAALGRPFYAAGTLAGLRSWSGSMFEYLMPTLLLDEPYGSVLHSAAVAAVLEQIAFGRERRVPWGISESAYAGSDQTLAYQYAPQGVPRLALRRTPGDELVVAPYATALAAQVAPQRAAANLHRLQQFRARDRYGFIEALDYSPGRQAGSEGYTPVSTFMAHHQGMTIVALANVLLDAMPRRWGMAEPHIEAVSSLLHERAPREVPLLEAPIGQPAARSKRASSLIRDVMPGMTALEPTHLLSNGRYAVALRANGAGSSRWGRFGISRARDDALRDAHGSFFYLRWDRQPRAVSITQHPAPDRSANYQSTFHADRVCFTATWSEIEVVTTVWVSPEDDLEFRQVELRSRGDRDLDLELISAFEVTLAEPRADESHPAFSNLFVTASWEAVHQALLFERKPRLTADQRLRAAHFLVAGDAPVLSVRIQVDRARWLGRNRDASHPLASFDEPPAAADGGLPGDGVDLVTGLDPVAAIAVRVRLPARTKTRLTFCTAASDNPTTLRAVIDKYRQPSHIERASMMSTTLTGIRLRETRISPEGFAAIQTLSTALALTLARPQAVTTESLEVCDRRLLWRFGISGDRPIVLVSAGVAQGLGLMRTLAQALRVWSWGGLACDVVVVNYEPASYLRELNGQIVALRDAYLASCKAEPGVAEAGFHLIAASDLQPDELTTLRALARIRLNADGRPLAHHVQDVVELHERALADRQAVSSVALRTDMNAEIVPRAPTGDFAATSGEFRFDVAALMRPTRPWVNVLANPDFGTQLTESGGGYSWALNSRLNQLTPWSNDPVADAPGEWFLLQDLRTMACWSVTPSSAGDSELTYRVAHGQGYSTIGHRRDSLEVNVSWCVDRVLSVKQVHLRLVNRGPRTMQLRAVGVVEWVMGAQRGDRATTCTAMTHVQSATNDGRGSPVDTGADVETKTTSTGLFCTQRDRSAGFGDGTAFFALAGAGIDAIDWTCDRRESFDARGRIVVPDHYGQASGVGLDPCAALAGRLTLRAGDSADCVFVLGFGTSPAAARELAERAVAVPPLERMQAVRARWDALLGATVVRTPDPLFDVLVNRWLLYQTIACRLWARAGFYQAGGAYGFRDQLQDAMALAWTAPHLLREQILLSASRQFPEGDVQHWWHAPTGAGVRTHFSDDLLWLPHACLHYIEATGEQAILDEPVAFIEGAAIPEGAEDAYYVPTPSVQRATLFEHCARAIDRSLAVGGHGLPLMGTGDWNDGMNRVGHEGRGESVWLAWFLADLVPRFAPFAAGRGENGRAATWQAAARGWGDALQSAGWDGAWFRRAYFDDGSPLGSAGNAECRIDLIAQAWAVLSAAAPEPLAAQAMASLDARLVDHDAGLVRLLDPPLADAQPSAGYIQAYPPGVRENGGQYSHAGVWAVMAHARRGDGDAAYRYFTYLSPAHRSSDPARAGAYAIEPFVMAGDVYGAPPYVGRGGWSWYTGSAAWMHRAAIESLFGLSRRGDSIT
ncbi:MAG: glucoamylase family protein, partial [Caldimonas sp.]